jgi:selenide,water dikinase
MAYGGGCGCKLLPAVLRSLLARAVKPQSHKQLLAGIETAGGTAVWQIEERTCLISTQDFFTGA